MPDPSSRLPLWKRIKTSRVAQALLVYLGAAWVILQITETLQGLLSLPEWIGPVEVIFLLLGMVVVLATAWVQSLPQTTAAEEAGEVPTDWEVDAADVIASLKAGRLPHLTWGRAVVGVFVALSLLFGSAGLWVLVNGPEGLVGPQEAGAAMAADGIAVLPFHVTGEGLQVYREGMVDLMAANLDGLSDFRAIDARTVLARWNREIGETADAELAAALRVAAGTGARYAVVGSGVEAGERIRFTAEIYDLDDGGQVGDGAQVEGAQSDVLGLVDALTVGVMRSVLEATGQTSQGQTFRLASLLTESVPALRHYLEGDAAFRRAHFEEARTALELAVEEDSTFALAYWRLGEATGWAADITNPESLAAKRRAKELSDRLPAREATLLELEFAIAEFAIEDEMPRLRRYLERYPDDPDGWYCMVEAGYHGTGSIGVTDAELEQALRRAVELDPTFAPYYPHALEWAAAKGDGDWLRGLLDGVRAVTADDGHWDVYQVAFDLLQDDEAIRAAAMHRVAEMGADAFSTERWGFVKFADRHLERLAPLFPAENTSPNLMLYWLTEQGRIEEILTLFESPADYVALLGSAGVLVEWRHIGAVSDEQLTRARDGLASHRDFLARFSTVVLTAAIGDQEGDGGYRGALRSFIDDIWATIPAGADSALARTQIDAMARVLDAEHMAVAGDPGGALRLLRGALPEAPSGAAQVLGFWEARFAAMAGRWEEAIPELEGWSRASWYGTIAKYWLGKGYEATGDTVKALDAYRTFLSRTEAADPGLAPVEEVREAVERLGG